MCPTVFLKTALWTLRSNLQHKIKLLLTFFAPCLILHLAASCVCCWTVCVGLTVYLLLISINIYPSVSFTICYSSIVGLCPCVRACVRACGCVSSLDWTGVSKYDWLGFLVSESNCTFHLFHWSPLCCDPRHLTVWWLFSVSWRPSEAGQWAAEWAELRGGSKDLLLHSAGGFMLHWTPGRHRLLCPWPTKCVGGHWLTDWLPWLPPDAPLSCREWNLLQLQLSPDNV